MTGVIYARYSEGPHQTDQSIEGQVADCQAYAAKNGINILGVYADRHISGKSAATRPEFQVAFTVDFSPFLPAFVCGRIVNNDQLTRWGVSVQDIFDNAIYNINRLKLIITPIGYDPEKGTKNMTVCSVQVDNDKAVAPWCDTGLLFSDFFLNRMYKKIHGPFFILLLSARKLYVAKTEYTPAQAYDMIMASSERPVDHLSYVVYKYDGRNMQYVRSI